MARVGVIGLGVMGRAMARNLLNHGHSVVVFNRTPERVQALVAEGASAAATCRDLAARSDIIITMLPDGPVVEAVTTGADGILEGAQPGSIMVDMSSVDPGASQRLADACKQKGVEFLDAPVSGGEPKAIDGTLAIMVGGNAQAFESVLPVLRSMGSTVTLVGPVGAGNVAKLANQIMVAANLAGMSEALVLATRYGLDPEVVYQAAKGGLAGSAVLDAKAPLVIARHFQPGGRIALHRKDLRNALRVASRLDVPLPVTSLVESMMTALFNQGRGGVDHGGLVLFIEQLASVEVRKPQAAESVTT